MNAAHAASLDDLIAYHEKAAAALRQAKAVITGDEQGGANPDIKLLTGPAPKGRRQAKREKRQRPPAKAERKDAAVTEEAELDGVSFAVTPLQGRLIALLGETEDYLTSAQLGQKLGVEHWQAKSLIYTTNEIITAAGCKGRINGYRKRGYRLESIEA